MVDNQEFSNEILLKNLEFMTKKNGITKKKIEEELNLGSGYLSKCSSEPSVHKMKLVADKLGVTVDELLYKCLEKEKKFNSYINKEKMFIDKLILETKGGVIKWDEIYLYEVIIRERYPDLFECISYEEDYYRFTSKFGNRCDDNLQSYRYILPNNEEVLIIGFYQKDLVERIYEIYIEHLGKIYTVCSSHYFLGKDEEKFKVLNELWDSITYDMPKMILSRIFDRYLEE